MKKFISTVLAICMSVLNASPFVFANGSGFNGVYNEPYDGIQTVKTYTTLDLDLENITSKGEGTLSYKEFIQNYDFTDVDGFYKKAATELAALGISYGIGNKKFGGSQKIKNIEAVAMFLRMFGAEEEVRKKVIEENAGATLDKLNLYFYDAYVEEAQNRGILPKDESLPYFHDATREDIANWFVKTSNLTNPNPRHLIKNASDAGLIKTENYSAVETLVDLGIMTISFGDAFGVRNPVRRQDFAKMIENTISGFGEILNLQKAYGMVIGTKDFKDDTGQYKDILLRTQENTVESIRFGTQRDGRDIGFPTLNGGLIYPDQIKKGMELEYLIRDGKIILARVLQGNEVKSGIVDKYAADKDVKIIQGVVKSNKKENVKTDNQNIERTRIRVELDDDRMVDFIDEKNLTTGIDNRLLVKNGKAFIPAESVQVGKSITAYIKGDNVLFLQIGREAIQVYKGELREIDTTSDPMTISVLDSNSKIIKMPLSKDTNYTVNYYKVELKDLKPGVPVSIISVRGLAEFVKVSSYQPPEGYITKRGKIQFAVVKSVGKSSLDLEGDVQYSKISPDTVLRKGGKDIKISGILAGDKVKLYYDDIYSDTPSKIVVEETGAVIEKLIKGELVDYRKSSQEITIKNPYVYENSNWRVENDSYNSNYKLSYDSEIYVNGIKIDAKELKSDHLEKTAYMVIRDSLNSKEISKMVFLSGYEKNMNDGVLRFDNTLNSVTLSGGKTLQYGDETIFIENERLVTKEMLKKGQNLQVVTNGQGGSDIAKIVKLLSENEGVLNKIFVGYVDGVNPFSVDIYDYSRMGNMNFSEIFDNKKNLKISDDTKIYDIDLEKYIDREKFFNGDYHKKENKNGNNKGLKNKRYYGFFVTDGNDNLIAAKLRYKGLIQNEPIDDAVNSESQVADRLQKIVDRLMFTRGKISEFQPKWLQVKLYESFNFFSYHREWRPNDKTTDVRLLNALIIKDGKVINYEDLRIEDKLFIVRDDDDGLLVLVE